MDMVLGQFMLLGKCFCSFLLNILLALKTYKCLFYFKERQTGFSKFTSNGDNEEGRCQLG
jgi:hypothetical protein